LSIAAGPEPQADLLAPSEGWGGEQEAPVELAAIHGEQIDLIWPVGTAKVSFRSAAGGVQERGNRAACRTEAAPLDLDAE
jgi:hypothetical protein